MDFQTLPGDVIIAVMRYLDARSLAALARTCRFIHTLVNESGWGLYVRLNPRTSYSLHKSLLTWDPRAQVRYHVHTDRNWAHAEFVARPLSRKWRGKLQPMLAINSSHLFVGVGNTIYLYTFVAAKAGTAPAIRFESFYTTSGRLQAACDITSITAVADAGLDRTVYVGYADGALERVVLPPADVDGKLIDPLSRDRYEFHTNDIVESLSSGDNYLLSLSSSGIAMFMNLASPSSTPDLLDLQARSWSTYLSTRGSSPYAVFGTSSVSPLVAHDIRPSGLSTDPFAVLTSGTDEGATRQSAVYGIAGAPPSSPWGSSDQILVSGWYDGPVRVHDLRSSSRTSSSGSAGGPASLKPVLSVYDPWLFEPNYSVSCGGGSSSYIAAGTARHSVVALWDVRSPATGWSVHAPGNDSSPVYSVILESSRLFGATQSRPFVLDFGPDSTEETYPDLSVDLHEAGRVEGLKKRDKRGIGFYVTKYSHSR